MSSTAVPRGRHEWEKGALVVCRTPVEEEGGKSLVLTVSLWLDNSSLHYHVSFVDYKCRAVEIPKTSCIADRSRWPG